MTSRKERGDMEIHEFEYFERLSDKIESIFHTFLRAMICSKKEKQWIQALRIELLQ